MDNIKEFFTSNTAKRFYWNVLSGAVGGAITYFSGISWIYAPFIIAVLNGISKELNSYFSNK